MKNLSTCESIEKILVLENIQCDAMIISNESLQYSLLYHSDTLKTFSDNMISTILHFWARQAIITRIPKIIHQEQCPRVDLNQLSSTLSNINKAFTTYQILTHSFEFFDEMNKLNRIRSLNYTSFYCARSDSFIILNNELLDQAFDDILQSKIDCDNLCGVYTNKDINKTLMIYYDPKGTQYKMSINSE